MTESKWVKKIYKFHQEHVQIQSNWGMLTLPNLWTYCYNRCSNICGFQNKTWKHQVWPSASRVPFGHRSWPEPGPTDPAAPRQGARQGGITGCLVVMMVKMSSLDLKVALWWLNEACVFWAFEISFWWSSCCCVVAFERPLVHCWWWWKANSAGRSRHCMALQSPSAGSHFAGKSSANQERIILGSLLAGQYEEDSSRNK